MPPLAGARAASKLLDSVPGRKPGNTVRSVGSAALLLAQSERSRRNIESGCAAAHADLASVRRIGAHGTITLASAAPEHVAQHP